MELYSLPQISFTPGFSPVLRRKASAENRFNGFLRIMMETVKNGSSPM